MHLYSLTKPNMALFVWRNRVSGVAAVFGFVMYKISLNFGESFTWNPFYISLSLLWNWYTFDSNHEIKKRAPSRTNYLKNYTTIRRYNILRIKLSMKKILLQKGSLQYRPQIRWSCGIRLETPISSNRIITHIASEYPKIPSAKLKAFFVSDKTGSCKCMDRFNWERPVEFWSPMSWMCWAFSSHTRKSI